MAKQPCEPGNSSTSDNLVKSFFNLIYGIPMARVTVFSTGTCPICEQTKKLLEKWSIAFDEIRLDQQPGELRRFTELTKGARMVPQILIDGKWIGGFTELTEMHMEDQLDTLMESP